MCFVRFIYVVEKGKSPLFTNLAKFNYEIKKTGSTFYNHGYTLKTKYRNKAILLFYFFCLHI
jgi:hypothetical protein